MSITSALVSSDTFNVYDSIFFVVITGSICSPASTVYSSLSRVISYVLSFTVTCTVATLPWSSVVAVTVAVPIPVVVTTPFSTVSTFASLVVHIISLNLASFGSTVATIVSLSPSSIVASVLSKVMLSTLVYSYVCT